MSYENKIEMNFPPFNKLNIDKDAWFDMMELKKYKDLIFEFEEIRNMLEPKFESYLDKIKNADEL